MLFLLLLARYVAPDAFGLLAMAMVVFELANVFITSGLGVALIRKKVVTDVDLSTVFYTNLILSAIAYIILFSTAPYIAEFYEQPELTKIIQAMGIVVFINATKLVQVAVLSRTMNFKAQMSASTSGAIGSGLISVGAAWLGLGVWSLVLQILSASLITSIVLWVKSTWRPSLIFSAKSFFEMLRFGKNLLIEGFMEILSQNSYILLIGRFFSAEITGLYFFASRVSSVISSQLTSAIQQATFPALSTLQDDDDSLLYKYRQIMQLMIFIIAPIMALLASLSPLIFELFLDKQWSGAVLYLQLLCIVGAVYPLHALNINLMNVKGRSDLVLKVGLIKKSVSLILLIAAIPFGVIAVVLSQVLGTILALIPNTYISTKLIGYTFSKQFKDIIKPVFSAICAGLVTFSFVFFELGYSFVSLFLLLILGCITYLVISAIIKVEGALMLWNKSTRLLKKTH